MIPQEVYYVFNKWGNKWGQSNNTVVLFLWSSSVLGMQPAAA